MTIRNPNIRKGIWQVFAIVSMGCCVGLLFNIVRSDGLNLVQSFEETGSNPADDSDGFKISVTEAEAFFLAQSAVFLDTRGRAAYASGHIQGARSLPWEEFDTDYEKVLEDVEKDNYIITYCDGAECHSSEHVAVALLEKGYSNVHVLFNGWSLWNRENLPVESGPISFLR